MKNNIFYISISIVLLLLLLLLNDPFMFWMPSGMEMIVLLVATALTGLWAGLLMKEQATDEREAEHRLRAGHLGYFSGILVLTTALLFQGFTHTIDPWITVALAVMILTKVITRHHSEHHR